MADDDDSLKSSAENKERKLSEEFTSRTWKPGQSGNPNGRPKKKPVTDLYEQILNDPEAIEMLRKSIVKALSKGQMAMVLQLREMTERVEGKVVQPIEADVNISMTLAERMRKARERSTS